MLLDFLGLFTNKGVVKKNDWKMTKDGVVL